MGKRTVWLTPPSRNLETGTETQGVAVHPNCLPMAAAALRHGGALAAQGKKLKAAEPSPTGAKPESQQIASSDTEGLQAYKLPAPSVLFVDGEPVFRDAEAKAGYERERRVSIARDAAKATCGPCDDGEEGEHSCEDYDHEEAQATPA